MKIKQNILIRGFLTLILVFSGVMELGAQNTRAERRLIMEGNSLYVDRQFKEAAKKYEEALKTEQSPVALYNLGLAQIRQVSNTQDTTPRTRELLENAKKNLSSVAAMAKERPNLASKANYNLGNLEFNSEKYQEAIDYYKQSLRINPADAAARKNLRIAQLKQQNQNQNQDNKQNRQQDQKDQQNNQQQNQQQQNQQQQNQQKENRQDQKISQQTANQILQAIDNKENQTRAKVNRANKGDKSVGGGSRTKKW